MTVKRIEFADWMNSLPLLQSTDYRKVVEEVCHEHGLDPAVFAELLRIEMSYAGSGRREGITEQVANAISDAMHSSED